MPQDPYAAIAQPTANSALPPTMQTGSDPYASIAKAPNAPGMLDREIPLDSYTHATESGLQSIGRGVRDAVKGTVQMLDPRAKDAEEEGVVASSPQGRAALPVYRILRSLGHTAEDATHIAGAIHDINQSPDPLGAYAKVAQETAGQGAGQALLALGTEGVLKTAPAVVRAIRNPEIATAPVRLAARGAETAINQKLVPLRPLANIMTRADEAAAAQFKVPGRDFGLKTPTKPPTPELDATGENKPFAGGMDEAAPAKPTAAGPAAPVASQPAAAAPTPSTSPAAVKQQLNNALGVEPVNIKPGVSMRNQAAAAKLPEGFTPVDSSVLKAYKYDPDTQEFDAITNSGQRFRHAEVSPDQFKAFEDADSKGKAWNDLRNGAGVTPLGKVNENGVLQPRIKPRSVVTDPETGAKEFSDVLDAKQNGGQNAGQNEAPKAKAAAAGAGADEDLTSLMQQSVDQAQNGKGVFTTADPGELTKRWGVSGSSVADTDANLRGLNLKESQDYVNKLAESYKNGTPVQPVLETRDAANNIVDVDGRHRALAAQKAGVKRIPVIVRRLGVTAQTSEELAARPQ
jgi:hypothetical protein